MIDDTDADAANDDDGEGDSALQIGHPYHER